MNNKLNLLATISASTLAAATGASAADLPIKSAAPAPVYVPTWAGFYLGINGGVITHQSTTKDLNNWADISYVSNNNQKATGGTFGGQIGWNWQDDAFVYGVEADINWVNAKSSDFITMCNGCGGPGIPGGGNRGTGGQAFVRSEMDWLATFRGRAGVTVGSTGATLLYITGGGALAHINNRWGAGYGGGAAPQNAATDSNFVSDNTKWGWVAGAGFEHRLTWWGRNWSFKGEALWIQFENTDVAVTGRSNFNGVNQTFHTQFQNEAVVGRVGVNYKF